MKKVQCQIQCVITLYSNDIPIEISEWFGTIESTFYDHPKAPHRDIFRVSNDRTEGCTNVGRTGKQNFHFDVKIFLKHYFQLGPIQGLVGKLNNAN